jgi:hypothetical protein
MRHIFNHQTIIAWLGLDIVPTVLESHWASMSGKAKGMNIPLLGRQRVDEEIFTIRLRQSGDDSERKYVGPAHANSNEALRAGDAYYRIATGACGTKAGSLEIGIIESDAHPIPFRAPIITATPALRMHFNYANLDAVSVGMVLRDETGSPHMLGLDRPRNDKQAEATLRMIGEAIGCITYGQDVDFGLIHMILKDHGMVDLKTPAPSLLAKSKSVTIDTQNIFGRLTA